MGITNTSMAQKTGGFVVADSFEKLRVTIGNSEYTLRATASAEHLRAVARMVDDLMRDLTAANPRLDERKAAVLAALNLAEDLLQLRENHAVLQAQYKELVSLLDEQTRHRTPAD